MSTMLDQRWYHVGRPWADTPGLIYAGSEDPHAGTFVVDCGDWHDELHFGVAPDKPPATVAELADRIVADHNTNFAARPLTAEEGA